MLGSYLSYSNFIILSPIALGLVGLCLPPKRNKPVGALFWIGILLLLASACEILTLHYQFCQKHKGSLVEGTAYEIFMLVLWGYGMLGLLLLAHTVWRLNQTGFIPADMHEEAQKELHQSLARKMWGSILLAGTVLLILPSAVAIFLSWKLGLGISAKP